MREGFHETTLRPLVASGSVRECKVCREGERGALWVRRGGPGSKWIPVRSQREPVRTWASLDTLVRFTDGLGIRLFAVES